MTAVTHAEELWVRIIAVLSRREQLPEQVEQMTPAELAAWAGRALNDERLLRFVSALGSTTEWAVERDALIGFSPG